MTTNVDAAPLLRSGASDGGGGRDVDDWPWWRKVLDLEEAKTQILFSLPMIATNVAYYLIPLVGVMFAGHQGDLELAGSTLANSWSAVTGYAFVIGLSGALETLCGQGYGAKMYRMMGIYLQSSCIITTFFCIIISIIWLFTEPILVLLQQEASIARTASQYIRYLIPGLFAYGYLNNLLRFLQTQSVVIPTVICSVGPLIVHIGTSYVLVNWTSMGFQGAALSVSISLWIALFMLGSYVICAERFADTWSGLSLESFSFVLHTMKLAIPSAAMLCLEYWAFEFLVLLAGLMSDSEITTSLIAMCVNTEGIAYMVTYGLSAAASTRVSNELGACNSEGAKHAMGVSVKLSVFLGLVVVTVLGFGHDIWAGFFSDSSRIIAKFSSVTPFLLVSIILDSIQGVLSGVARGCGWQHLAVYINLAMFYCIGMPIAILLGFTLNLEAQGLWLGLICGLFCQTVALLVLTYRTKWERIDVPGNKRLEEPVSA